jgi:CHAT domain-containing protein
MSSDENTKSAPLSDKELLRFLESPTRDSHKLQAIAVPVENDPGQCGSPAHFMDLVLGSADSGESARLLEHAAHCAACGKLLAQSLSTLDGNPTQEETAAIAEFSAAAADWQHDLARRLAATDVLSRPGLIHLVMGKNTGSSNTKPKPAYRWRLAIAVAAGVIAVAGIVLWQRQVNSPEYLLARAYTEQRHLELRIQGAGYGAISDAGKTRGSSMDHEPAALLNARAKLARELESAPQDARLLQLQARADTLEQRYDSAIETLDRLLTTTPVTADLLLDAAAAYYQRGLLSENQLDRSTALDYLRRADELAPADPVILFNEAIVMEDRGQMINALELWTRYLVVERDPKWSAEGQRKKAALEQTLNRLKSHEDRIRQMLATPDGMEALARNASALGALDEELSTMRLNSLLPAAFPILPPAELGQARGSPCAADCAAARTLLRAVSKSLENRHQDFWLSDLLLPEIDSLPAPQHVIYASALQTLGRAIDLESGGSPAEFGKLARQSEAEFRKLDVSLNTDTHTAAKLRLAKDTGIERATLEYLIALARLTDFRECRAYAQQLRAQAPQQGNNDRHPWMQAVTMLTEKVCDDTPETRLAGLTLQSNALQLAESSSYLLLNSRVQARIEGEAQVIGDNETLERIALAALGKLKSGDVPPWRILNAIGEIAQVEEESPRAHVAASCVKENVAWAELAHSPYIAAGIRVELAQAELRIGDVEEFHHQLKLADEEASPGKSGASNGADISQSQTILAKTLLESGDLNQAGELLEKARPRIEQSSDTWGIRNFAVALGQLELSQKRYDQAATMLEAEIRLSEGKHVQSRNQNASAEYAELDHDLYGELVATWLAQGKSPASALGLWERFRLRAHELPIRQCAEDHLDCEQSLLERALKNLGANSLTGQVVLMDRVLIYRVDGDGVHWTQKQAHRQGLLDSAQILETAVSSPLTTQKTAASLSAGLARLLLPELPANPSDNSLVFLEPDPLLRNLPWTVLPTATGPLGLRYLVSESRSILDESGIERANLLSHQATSEGRKNRDMVERPLMIAATVSSNDESPLPEALTETQDIERYLQAPKLLAGRQATSAQVAAALGTASVFHFAGHAVQRTDGTELLLANSPGEKSPWIDGAFLRRHPPRLCRLAVLSACSTGKREAGWNHPLQDIVETFSSLGVPEVVATRWQVDSEASVPFMDAFYRKLSEINSVTQALTYARRIQSDNYLYRNPYYWGAYYVTGMQPMPGKSVLYARNKEDRKAR